MKCDGRAPTRKLGGLGDTGLEVGSPDVLTESQADSSLHYHLEYCLDTNKMAEYQAPPSSCHNHTTTTKKQSMPVTEWTPDHVIEWMNRMHLFSYVDYFKKQDISGAQLLDLDDKTLQEMGIEDSFQRKKLMACLKELCERPNSEEIDSDTASTESSDECTSDSSEHDLHEHVFTTPVKCHKCGKYINCGNGSRAGSATGGYAVQCADAENYLVQANGRTAYQCSACGLCLHRECIQGKIQPCNSEKLESRKKSHLHQLQPGMAFGSDLCNDVPQSHHRTVPDIIYLCAQEIERQAALNHDLNVIEAYRVQKSSEDVCLLKCAFDQSSDKSTVPILNRELSTLCGVVKKYLRELTNPLIPTEFYEDFISAAKHTVDGVAGFSNLVNQLPKHHSSTLHYLFTHFYKLVEHESTSSSSKIDNSYLALAQIFCHIILRPDWSEITNLVQNTQYHVIVIRRLFSLYGNNNTESSRNVITTTQIVKESACTLQSACSHGSSVAGGYHHTQINTSASAPSSADTLLPLDHYQWYWGEVSREEVSEATSDVEDGSFLLRNATSHPTHGDYTLVLRKGGGNLLIKIHHRHGHYGFCADSCPFESVPALISYYQHHSLAEYNATLNIRLRRGIARTNQFESLRSSDPQYLLKQLKRNHTELQSLTRECDHLLEKQIRMSHDIQLLHQAQESFKELSKIFEEQIEQYSQQKATRVSDVTTSASNENNEVQKTADVLRARLQSINLNKDRLGDQIEEKTGSNSVLASDINTIKPTLRTLSRKQDHIINALLAHGITRHELEQMLRTDNQNHSHSCVSGSTSNSSVYQSKHSNPTLTSSKQQQQQQQALDIPHTHRTSWFVNCSRQEATEILQHRKDGTFLIRPGSQDNPYTLSISINGMVGHCKVLNQDGKFGFAAPYILHDSLVELVLYYKDHSLASHNPQLNTRLVFPINQRS